MKYILTFLISVFAFITGCKKSTESILPDGVYKGVFYRTSPWSDTAQITLTFSGNHFTGESNNKHYPAICNGSFSIDGNKIKFENNCPWTADFDWTFILGGDYELKSKNGKIEMSRGYDGIIYYKNVYELTKQ